MASPQRGSYRLGSVRGMEELQKNPANLGPWLALVESRGKYKVIARGKTASKVYGQARKRQIETPIITNVPSPNEALFL